MILKNTSLDEFARYVHKARKRIVLFGAGTLLTSWIAYILEENVLMDDVKYVLDNDSHKWGERITINQHEFTVSKFDNIAVNDFFNTVILITSSYFATIIDQLDEKKELKEIECYVAPIMHITNFEKNYIDLPKYKQRCAQIPKVIHYCWFGEKPMPDRNKECIESWKKYCPDYDLVEWNEKNYDIKKNRYMRQAYEVKKYGYVPDYARIDILYHYGGIYLDTDVEIIRNIDELLYFDAFSSFEEYPTVNFGGGSGSKKGIKLLKDILDFRENIEFVKADGSYNRTTCGYYESIPLKNAGLKLNGKFQKVNDLTVFPSDFFHPKSSVNGLTKVTKNTFSIHQFNWSWVGEEQMKEKRKTHIKFENILQRMEQSYKGNEV